MKPRRGTSLLELLLAMGLFGVCLALFGSLSQSYVNITRYNDQNEEPLRLAQECLNRIRADLGSAVSVTLGGSTLTVGEIDPNAVRFPAGTSWDPTIGSINVVYQVTPQGLTRQVGASAADVLSSSVTSLAVSNTADQLVEVDLGYRAALGTLTVSTQAYVMTRFL